MLVEREEAFQSAIAIPDNGPVGWKDFHIDLTTMGEDLAGDMKVLGFILRILLWATFI